MWRINAVRYYQYLLFSLILIEVIVILAVVILMGGFSLNIALPFELADFLLLAVVITSLILLNLFSYTIIYQVISNRSDKDYQENYHLWMKKWAQTYFMQEPLDTLPLNRAVVEAHLEFTKSLPEKRVMIELANDYKITDFWRKQLRTHNKIKVLRAIEALSLLGNEDDFDILLDYIVQEDLDLRISAITSLAYITRRLPDDMLNTGLEHYCAAILRRPVPVFVIEDVYSILDSHHDYLNTYFLSQETIPDNVLQATIKVVGTHYNTHFAKDIAPYLHHGNPIIQQAVLKAFAQLNFIPRDAYPDVLQSIIHDNQSVREQALMTLQNTPLYQTRLSLWLSLGDQNWWVRFAAARQLKSYGDDGETVLRSASKKHISAEGREIALKVLNADI